jgi:uncharacterized protein
MPSTASERSASHKLESLENSSASRRICSSSRLWSYDLFRLFFDIRRTMLQDDPILQRFIRSVRDLPQIRKIVLFGSRARGEELPWSDYDLLVLVDRREQSLVDRIYDAVVEIQADTGCDLSLKIISEAEWDRRREANSSFVANILREGIVVG